MQEGQTLLQALEPAIPYLSAGQWRDLMLRSHIKLNGAAQTTNILLKEGDEIVYVVPNYEEAEVNTGWKLLWHNEHLAAIHKPANLPVSRTTRNVYNTLIQLLRRESPWPDAHLLHRLDLETSGVVLIATSNDQARIYQPKLSELLVTKRYRAIVHGVPSWQAIQHSSYINTRKDSAIRCQMHPVDEGNGKLSQTHFKVIASNCGYSLIECELLTGRKHQIRAHLLELGHPIIGDKIYSHSGEYYLKRLNDALTYQDKQSWLSEHHLLHAYEVHVKTVWQQSEEIIEIQNPNYPSEWIRFCNKVGLPIS